MAQPLLSIQDFGLVAEGDLSTAMRVLLLPPAGSGQPPLVNGSALVSDFQTFLLQDVDARLTALENGGGSGGPSIWPHPVTLNLTGPITGSVAFDGSTTPITLATSVTDDSLPISAVEDLSTTLLGKVNTTDALPQDSNYNTVTATGFYHDTGSATLPDGPQPSINRPGNQLGQLLVM